MSSEEIRKKFLEFFKERGHAIVPSSSLIPTDPSVLLTTAGMQQFKKYYTGELDAKHDFGSLNTASVQKCFRTSDIDEVGDESHLTFFEMLGNFSFGGYFKEKAIEYAYEFITSKDWMNLKIDYVTVFDGGKLPDGDWRKTGTSIDQESYNAWLKIFLKEGFTEDEINKSKIRLEGADVFWGPTGAEGPCGPTTEIYVKNVDGKSIEIWNIVFNQFYCDKNKNLRFLETFGGGLDKVGVDTGMGLERLAMVVQKVPTIFETDLFDFILKNLPTRMRVREKRIVADHLRGIAFLIADEVLPSNKDQGYVLRKLIRRVLVQQRLANSGSFSGLDIISFESADILSAIVDYYKSFYKSLNKERVLNVFHEERKKFEGNLEGIERSQVFDVLLEKAREKDWFNQLRGLIRKFIQSSGSYDLYTVTADRKMIWKKRYDLQKIADFIFDLCQNQGGQFEIILDLLRQEGIDFSDEAIKILRNDFEERFKQHQEISRAGAVKKFGGHGLILNTGELKAGDEAELKKVTRLHTATHLLHRALREVLGNDVHQMGSDITTERTRFDFSFNRKMTPEEVKKVEEIANEKVKEDLPVQFKEMAKDEAEKTGALHFFKEKYPEKVKVYYIGKDLASAWSKEFCGGPHVTHTGEIGHIKILKEEAVGAGARRLRVTVE